MCIMMICQVVVVIPEVPGFAGDIRSESGIKTIMAAQYRTINRGGHSIYEEIKKAGYDPYVFFSFQVTTVTDVCRTDYIRFFHLRSYDRINAPDSELLLQYIWILSVAHDADKALSTKWRKTPVLDSLKHK